MTYLIRKGLRFAYHIYSKLVTVIKELVINMNQKIKCKLDINVIKSLAFYHSEP